MIANRCPFCGAHSIDNDFCAYCRSDARDYLRKFELYDGNSKEQLYELLKEEAEKLEMNEYNKKRKLQKGDLMHKAFDMVEYARDICIGKRDKDV